VKTLGLEWIFRVLLWTGGDGKRLENAGGMGITIRKIAVDTWKQGKVTLIPEKGFLQPVLL